MGHAGNKIGHQKKILRIAAASLEWCRLGSYDPSVSGGAIRDRCIYDADCVRLKPSMKTKQGDGTDL